MFKVGDLVQWRGRQGVVAVIDDDGWYGVDFGRGYGGHNLFGALERDTGWFISPRDELTLVVIDLENK
jgi:hypothetical protein